MSGGILATLNFLVKFLRFLPHKYALTFGRITGRLLRLILWRKTDRCEARCVMSLGVGVTVSREIVRGSFMNLGMSAVEFIRLPKIISRINELVAFPENGINLLRSALSRGKGVILMTSHMANWELAAARVIHEGFPLHAVYTPQSDRTAESIIMSIRENASGMSMIDSNKGLREIFRVLRAGGIVVIMQDLDARKDGIITDFFGIPASTHDGIVKLYRKFHCPVIPAQYVRDKDNPSHHSINFYGILSDMKDADGRAFGEDMQGSLRMCNQFIEGCIKERPELWLWLLDKWEYTLGKNI